MICMQFVVPVTVKEIPKLVNYQIFKSLLAIQLYENCVAVVHVNVCWFSNSTTTNYWTEST